MNQLIQTEIDKTYLAELLQLKADHPMGFGAILSGSRYQHLLKWLNGKTPALQDKKFSSVTKLYWVAHGFTDFPVCGFCHKEKLVKNIDSFERGYFRACSVRCSGMIAVKKLKIEQTCLKNWGSPNFFSSAEGHAVKRKWCEDNGVENPFQLESVKAKSCASRKARFGYEYTMQSAEKRKLASDNYRDKTGYGHQFENPEVVRKSMRTKELKKASGIDLHAKTKITNRRARYSVFLRNSEIRPMFSESDFLKLNAKTQYTTLLRWKCIKCGTEFDAYIDQNFSSRTGFPVRCLNCHPLMHDGVSEFERGMSEFLKTECNVEIVENSRSIITPYELDMYMPSANLAIEFDGLYWHSDAVGKSKMYHLTKTEMCRKLGIRLVHVFEDEWRNKREVTKSRIKAILGLYSETIDVNECEIHSITPSCVKAFFDENSLDNYAAGALRFGLYHNSRLVSAMVFKKHSADNGCWEITGICDAVGLRIAGAFGAMLGEFERQCNPKSVIIRIDRRWNANWPEQLGFNFVNNLNPDYYYVKGNCRYSKSEFKKLRQAGAYTAGEYSKLYDCGTAVFKKTYSETV